MVVVVKNLVDFETMITTCIYNGESGRIRVFISDKKSSSAPGTSFGNDGRSFTKFTYVLFAPMYNVIFTNKITTPDYDDMQKRFFEFHDRNADKFRIQVFDSIKIDEEKNQITVEKELYVL